MNKSKGFTLIELLIVIAIIAVLVSILIPALGKAKYIAQRSVCGAQLRQIGRATMMYSDDYKGALPDERDLNGDFWHHAYGIYRDNQSGGYKTGGRDSNGKLKPFRFAYLYELNYIDTTPKIFYCPGNQPEASYERYTNPPPWGTLPQYRNTVEAGANGNQWVRIGYTYFPMDRKAKEWKKDRASKFQHLNTYLPYTTDFITSLGNLSHQYDGIYELNALFPDGRVDCIKDQEVFADPVWDNIGWPHQPYYYTIFRLIGGYK